MNPFDYEKLKLSSIFESRSIQKTEILLKIGPRKVYKTFFFGQSLLNLFGWNNLVLNLSHFHSLKLPLGNPLYNKDLYVTFQTFCICVHCQHTPK